MLSKSRYLKGLKCEKALWLYQHKRDEVFYPESTQQVFAVGNAAGELAQDYFPNGTLALVDDYPNYAAAQKTQELIAIGETTIYEATFIAQNTLVALDILHKIDGKWHAFEVKSTNDAKKEHKKDAAIQYYVMTASGIEIEDISIMHFDRDYVRQGEIDPRGLFTYTSVMHDIKEYLEDIPDNIDHFLEVLKGEEPIITVGDHCDTPYPCEFANYCARLDENQELLNTIEQPKAFNSAIIHKDTIGITKFLNDNPYPIYSLDFESIQYGIPEFDTSRPYQQITFQYSLHYQKDANSEPIHFEFLGNGIDDPREALIQQMIQDLNCFGADAKILMYSSFEKTMITKLMRDFPKYKKELHSIKERLVDLGVVFRKYLKNESTLKTWSLKVVLPTFLPDYSYEDLAIQNGLETAAIYRNLSSFSAEEQEKKITEMLAYCELDTLAVLKLYNSLYKL